jgi:hypothetical protein
VSVTCKSKDPIPHGLEGYRKYGCTCDDGTVKSCLGANRAYQREMRARRADAKLSGDELAAKRTQRSKGPVVTTKRMREAAAKRRKTETNDSVGEMEQAVITECAGIADAKPTLVVAAKHLGRNVDALSGNAKTIALYNSTMKQLMATMAELRGDKAKTSVTGRKKSGGRLATVGNLTKVKRQ